MANSSGIIHYPDSHLNMVRPGISLYGGHHDTKIKKYIKPVVKLKAKVLQIKQILKDQFIGYNQTYKTEKKIYVAILGIGYADGLPQNLRDGTKVLINNKIAEIFGKISMDLTTIDISKAGKCQIGDWCEFFSPKLSINLISDTNSLIPYELMTKITPRVKRKFINDNS